MHMVFNEHETMEIIRAHLVEKWAIPHPRIKTVNFSTTPVDGKAHLVTTVDVETDRGGPYREQGGG